MNHNAERSHHSYVEEHGATPQLERQFATRSNYFRVSWPGGTETFAFTGIGARMHKARDAAHTLARTNAGRITVWEKWPGITVPAVGSPEVLSFELTTTQSKAVRHLRQQGGQCKLVTLGVTRATLGGLVARGIVTFDRRREIVSLVQVSE